MPAIVAYGAGILLVWENAVGCGTEAYEERRVVQVVAIAISWPFTLWFPFLLVAFAFVFAVKTIGMLASSASASSCARARRTASGRSSRRRKCRRRPKEVQRAFDDEPSRWRRRSAGDLRSPS